MAPNTQLWSGLGPNLAPNTLAASVQGHPLVQVGAAMEEAAGVEEQTEDSIAVGMEGGTLVVGSQDPASEENAIWVKVGVGIRANPSPKPI